MNQHSPAAHDSSPIIDPQTLIENPHMNFAALRVHYPVIRLGERHFMALRANDVLPMFTDPRTRQIEGKDYVRLNQIPKGVTARLVSDFFLFSNEDEHRTKRGLFARTFAFGAMREATARIRATADRIVAELPRGESFDFVERMAARIPSEMIAAILGLPAGEAEYFVPRVNVLARSVAPVYPHARHREIETAAADLFSYVEGHLRSRLEMPGDDLLSTLVTDWNANPVISFESLVHQVLGIIVGGSDTTRAGFAMMIALLLRHRDQWEALRADPTLLIPGAVNEALRYDPPVGSIARFTREEVEIGGARLPAGVMLRLSTMSAMRDRDLYARPDQFDITRTDHPRLHTVFGFGPHRCLGEMLARLEMQEGLAALLAAAPDIRLETSPRLLGFGGIREITRMQVRIR